MAVRQEEEQAGKRVNLPAVLRRHGLLARTLIVLLAFVALVASPLPVHADDTDDSAGSSQIDGSGDAGDIGNRPKQSLTIERSTAVVTDSSGFHVTVMVANNDDKPTPAGRLDVSVNALFTFVSRTDIQAWAEGDAPIPTPDGLGSVQVPVIAPGSTVSVTLDVPANHQGLAAISTWGPKPLLISYIADGQILINLTSFLTRSADGLDTAQTPAMNLTVAMPLTADGWQADTDVVDALIADKNGTDTTNGTNGNATSSGKPGTIGGNSSGNGTESSDAGANSGSSTGGNDAASGNGSTGSSGTAGDSTGSGKTESTKTDPQPVTLSEQEEDSAHTLMEVAERHRNLQVVADPLYLRAADIEPIMAGIMQPADFDITAYTAIGNERTYRKAGVDEAQWNADQAKTLVNGKSVTTYAWQGNAGWSLKALTKAREQGYSTVIADDSFDAETTDTVHTGTYVVNTPAGDVTVLKEQAELSALAQGQATSKDAAGETSDAGRLARLLAQSAFYQMEQPYTARNLLMTFSRASSSGWVDQVMGALEQASWLRLTDLETMAKTEPYSVSDTVNLSDAATDASAQSGTRTVLDQLNGSRKDILRLGEAVLKQGVDSDSPALDPQALARQDAKDTASRNGDPTEWVASLLAAHDDFALHALSGTSRNDTAQRMVNATRAMADTLLGKVSITPSESVSVFSESAKMPVTISNKLPYAVSVTVNSITDSMQIVTSRSTTVDVPANGEAQVSFTIRVSTSGSTTAHVSLADRDGRAFGNVQDTAITSVMRISDMSGFVIIGFAVLLGIMGLWRQFNRKKDPDE